jgi:hypothetical protein
VRGENHNGAIKGGGSSSGGSLNKPTSNECRHFGKMGHSTRKCCLKPEKEHAHATQDEEEGSFLVKATLTRLEAGGPTAVRRANRRWWSDRAQDGEIVG